VSPASPDFIEMMTQSVQGLHHTLFSLNANVVNHDVISLIATAW
jgi:hypothetical protein